MTVRRSTVFLPPLLFTCALLVAFQAGAEGALQWQSNRLAYLYGRDFVVNPARQHTVTLEHASGWRYGDLFAFIDVTRFSSGRDAEVGRESWYGEFSPRLSLGKLTDRTLRVGPLQDLLLAATAEFGEGAVETLLLGPGFDLALPGFDYLQLNLYRRMPDGNRDGESWQITPVWGSRFPVAGSEVRFDGFIDWIPEGDGDYHHNLHINPQLTFDAGRLAGQGSGRLYLGVEYSYWSNKYGITDSESLPADQSVTSLLIKLYL